jgi:hypothetical protein
MIKLGGAIGGPATKLAPGDQDGAVGQQRRAMTGTAGGHVTGGRERMEGLEHCPRPPRSIQRAWSSGQPVSR